MKYAYLHKVDGSQNNNKFYEMKENVGANTFTVLFGREGATKPQTKVYPLSQWDSVYKEKTSSKKGYTDVTDFKAVKTLIVEAVTSNTKIANDAEIVALIELLQSFAKGVTAKNYKVEAKEVTQAQIDAAQSKLDELSNYLKNSYGKSHFVIKDYNQLLEQLFIIIPRKMKRVADHLITDLTTKDEMLKGLDDEQTNIDAMASQVASLKAQTQDPPKEQNEVIIQNKTLLESLGLVIEVLKDKKIIEEVKKLAQEHGKRIKNIYSVTNLATQKDYDSFLATKSNKKSLLLWHGSRVANWFSIIQQGLKIRPATAVYTGSMFGAGVYFSLQSDKSMGYTDSGRWVNNGQSVSSVFMALYEVHIGNYKEINRHDSSCYDLHDIIPKSQYDSTWAKKGVSLYRDEIIIYNTAQSTIKYLVEFRN